MSNQPENHRDDAFRARVDADLHRMSWFCLIGLSLLAIMNVSLVFYMDHSPYKLLATVVAPWGFCLWVMRRTYGRVANWWVPFSGRSLYLSADDEKSMEGWLERFCQGRYWKRASSSLVYFRDESDAVSARLTFGSPHLRDK